MNRYRLVQAIQAQKSVSMLDSLYQSTGKVGVSIQFRENAGQILLPCKT
ncbi:MAG TPA: hypothetical protein VN729_03510 [Ktedonobacteraceae bacterium]|nr:hypothetical protein [Ktedonobacteraceae bacterium]